MLSIQRQIARCIELGPEYFKVNKNVLFLGFQPGYKISTETETLWNGQILRNGNFSGSGTHQSIVAMSEIMASEGYNVYISFRTCIPNTVVNKVNYINDDLIHTISNDISIIIAPSWIDPVILRWDSLRKYVIWTHVKERFPNEVNLRYFSIRYPKCKFYINTLTNFTKRHLDFNYRYYSKYIRCIGSIVNPMLLDMTHPVTKKDTSSFIFHASFERGGELACKVFNNLNLIEKKMELCSYLPDDLENKDNYTISFKNKKEIFETLSRTEYFIYPGVSSKSYRLSKETDCLTIAECLLHEVIVLAFPVGALYENYGECVIWIPFPSETDLEQINSTLDTPHPELSSISVIESICNIIYDLEANPSKKEEIRRKGREHVLKQRNPIKIRNEFFQLLNL